MFKEVTSRDQLSQHLMALLQLSLSYAAHVKLGTTMSPSGRMSAPLLKDLFVVLFGDFLKLCGAADFGFGAQFLKLQVFCRQESP